MSYYIIGGHEPRAVRADVFCSEEYGAAHADGVREVLVALDREIEALVRKDPATATVLLSMRERIHDAVGVDHAAD